LGRSLSVSGNRAVKSLGTVVLVVVNFIKEKEGKTKKAGVDFQFSPLPKSP